MRKFAALVFAITAFLSISAQAGFPLNQCRFFTHISYAECTAEATINKSKSTTEMQVWSFNRASTALYEHIVSKYGKTANMQKPINITGNFQLSCPPALSNYGRLEHTLLEMIKQDCNKKGKDCPIAPYLADLKTGSYHDLLLQTGGNSFYVLFSGNKTIITNDELEILLQGERRISSFDRQLGIGKEYQCTENDKGRKCQINYIKFSKNKAEIIKSIKNDNAPDVNTPQLEYEWSIKFQDQEMESDQCPYLTID